MIGCWHWPSAVLWPSTFTWAMVSTESCIWGYGVEEDAWGAYALLSASSVIQPVESLRFPLSQQEVGLFFCSFFFFWWKLVLRCTKTPSAVATSSSVWVRSSCTLRNASELKSTPTTHHPPAPPISLHEPANLRCCSSVNRHSAVAVVFFFFFFSCRTSDTAAAPPSPPLPPPPPPHPPSPETVGTSDDSPTAEVWKLMPSWTQERSTLIPIICRCSRPKRTSWTPAPPPTGNSHTL